MVYISFLRGINVGSHRVSMADLKNIFEAIGFTNVRSYINSGNIFFNSNFADNRMALTQKIEVALEESLGYEVAVFLRTVEEIDAIIEQEPFTNIELDSNKRFCVVFTKERIGNNLQLPISSSKNDMDLVGVSKYEAYIVWHIINGRPPSSKFGRDILPSSNTSRFYHTLIKILSAAKAA